MAKYLLIESRDCFGSDAGFCRDLAKRLTEQGETVSLFLVENGVLSARTGSRASGLVELARAGVEILADDFSLRERGIPPDRLSPGVNSAPLDTIVDRLANGCKALWH